MTRNSFINSALPIALLVQLCLVSGFAQNPESPKAPAVSDSSQATVGPADTTAARLQLRQTMTPLEWQRYSQMQQQKSVTFTAPGMLNQLDYLPPAAAPGNPYMDNLQDFQGSTAYQLGYSDVLRKEQQAKPERGNGFVVPVLPLTYLAVYGSYKGFMALKGDPPIAFDETDLSILELMWQEPDLQAIDYYTQFNTRGLPGNMTFMTLQQRLDKLRSQKVVAARQDGIETLRYRVQLDRLQLRQLVDLELGKSIDGQDPTRLREVEKMKTLLSDGNAD